MPRVTRRAVFDNADGTVITGLFHTERRKDLLLQKVGVSLSGRVFDDRAEKKIAGIAVRIFFADRKIERFVLEQHEHIGVRHRERRGFSEVGKTCVVRQAGGMCQEIFDSNRLPRRRTFRQMFTDRIIHI